MQRSVVAENPMDISPARADLALDIQAVALDGWGAGRGAILAAVLDPEASVRRQAIRQLGTRRVRAATEVLVVRLRDEDASVRFRVVTALGRIGDSAAVPGLIEGLDELAPFARYAAFTALNRFSRVDPTVWLPSSPGRGTPRRGPAGRQADLEGHLRCTPGGGPGGVRPRRGSIGRGP